MWLHPLAAPSSRRSTHACHRPTGATVTIGCSTCLCHDGSLQCDMRECEVVLSEWSGWTRCSPCVLQHNSSQMVSIQRRFRACLDLDSGLPVSKEEESQCPGLLVRRGHVQMLTSAEMCVSGVGGVLGQRVLSRAAVESGSATDSPWPLLQDPV
uniref:SCO-spondin-like n=1 Tax=Maylandia zebra TaxID=106582 RepID=UPI000D307028|nr:SCO-spondin-like [Maylandia zebra]